MPTPRLESGRVALLPWESTDWLAFKPIATNPDVMRYVSRGGLPWDDAHIIEFVERQRRHFCERGFCLWKALLRDSGRLIGFCGLQPVAGLPEIEIGWWLAPDLWRRGIATEAAKLVLADGFDRLGLQRIVAVAQRENRASTRIMEKLGMTYERDAVHRGIPVVLYAVEQKAS